ncbi:MAG: F420-dependent NADP oxidoreductase [Roseivirga sp.]
MQQKIAILGTGNVAWHLNRAFENAGHIVTDIYSRDLQKAERFTVDSYQAEPTSSLDFSRSDARIFIMAISDDAVAEMVENLQLPSEAVLAHTSGTLSIKAIGYAPTEDIGVFYPLQTLSKGKGIDFEHVPICIEGETLRAQNELAGLASSLSQRVQMLDSGQRRLIHLAAVFACNFTNHMLTLSKQILAQQEIDLAILHPLISETLNKSLEIGPEKAQTGPAIRRDMETLDKQHQALHEDEQVAEIYQLISQHILDYYAE